MGRASSKSILRNLRQRIALLERPFQGGNLKILPFGVSSVDEHLPQGGLSLGALHEIAAGNQDGDETAATLFVAGILARTTGYVVWCVKSFDLFIHGLANAGLIDERIIFVEAQDEKTVLLVMEEALRHVGLAGVVGEMTDLSKLAARRLHIASRTSGVTGFLLRRLSHFQKNEIEDRTAILTRWQISSLSSPSRMVRDSEDVRWKIELTDCQNAEAAEWTMKACDASGHLSLPSEFVGRSNVHREGERLSA